MLDAGRLIARYSTGKHRQDLDSDGLLTAALGSRVLIICESCQAVSNRLKVAYPEVPWNMIQAIRPYRVVDDQAEIDRDNLWLACTVSIPETIPQLESMLASVGRKLGHRGSSWR